MSFVLPTTVTIVDKYPLLRQQLELVPDSLFDSSTETTTDHQRSPIGRHQRLPTIWKIVAKYDSFRELVRIARMEDILDDPQANLTLFIPTDLMFPRTTLKACIGRRIEEKDILAIDFETARKMVNSIIIPSILSTTTMMQSAFTRYRTRDTTNTLTTTTQHCVQFEPQTYNRPPFGLVLNGKARILTPDILASNGLVHTVDMYPYFF